MNLVFFLKIFCDLCYYAIFAGFFAGAYGQQTLQFPALLLLAAVACLCRLLWDREPFKRRYLIPLPLVLTVFAIPAQTAGTILLGPAVLYTGWTVWSRRMQPNYYDTADHFRMELKILPLPLLFAITLQQLTRIERFAAPYALAFVLASVLLLRMVRHDETTLRQPKFRLLNLLNLALVCLACAVLGSAWFRGLLLTGLKLIWKAISWPLLAVMLTVGVGMGYLLQLAIPENFHFDPLELEGFFQELGEEQEKQEIMEEAANSGSETVMAIFSVLTVILAVILIIWLFRKLAAGRERIGAPEGGVQSRYSAMEPPKGEKPLSRLSARTPAQQVRYWYRQFLKKTQRQGGALSPNMNTLQQNAAAWDVFRQEDDLNRLRALYLPARYRDTATAEDARAAKELVRRLGKD